MSSEEIGRALQAFMTDTCPACAVQKLIPRDPFCLECLEKLPAGLLESVTDRDTYMEAFEAALEHLRSGRRGS